MKALTFPRKPKESDIKRSIRQLLRWHKIPHWNMWQGQFSEPGILDLLGLLPGGRFFGIEVKVDKSKLRRDTKRYRDQQGFIDWVNETGGIAFRADCLEDVVERLGLQDVRLGPLFAKGGK